MKRTDLIYAVFIPLFGLAAYSKFSGGMPEWFVTQFQDTFLKQTPGGLALSFYLIALLEGLTALGFALSLLNRIFQKSKENQILEASLFLAMTTFAVLGFGLRLSHDFNGAFQLFGYFGITFLIQQRASIY